MISDLSRLMAALAVITLTASCGSPTPDAAAQPPITVYVAKTIITMEPDQPKAQWVAAESGKIVALSGGEVPESIEGKSP